MSLTADVAIGAAERLERTAGAAPGLAVFSRLANGGGSSELRSRAILGGLRCALAIRDLGALRDLSLSWATVEAVSEQAWDELFATCKALSRAGLGICATALAHAEVRRAGTARALYAYARCLDVSRDPKAGAAFRDAIARGEKEGAAALVRASRVRCAVWLARSPETLSEALAHAKKVATADATPAERLELARVLLRAPSRFVRTSALALLDDVVSCAGAESGTDEAALAPYALVLAARHADDMNDELTPLEVDRLVALFSREPAAKKLVRARETIRAIDRLARAKDSGSESELEAALDDAARLDPELEELHRRARDILRGRFEAWDSQRPSAYPDWAALLDAVVAMRDASWPRVARALRRLAESAERGARIPPHVWSVAMAALGTDDVEVRGVAGRLVLAMMKTTTAAPPRGWLGLAHALAACGMEHVAVAARRSAALANEAGAAEALGLSLTRSGWRHALAGDRSQAIARLREARALATNHRPPRAAAPSPGDGAPTALPPLPGPLRGGAPSRST